MEKVQFMVLPFISIVGSFLTFVFGGGSSLILMLFIAVVIDYVSGILAAFINKSMSSNVGLKGISKKVLIFALVAVTHMIDQILGDQHFIRDATILFYLLNEIISIIENATRVGIPIPQFLYNALEIVKNKTNKKK